MEMPVNRASFLKNFLKIELEKHEKTSLYRELNLPP